MGNQATEVRLAQSNLESKSQSHAMLQPAGQTSESGVHALSHVVELELRLDQSLALLQLAEAWPAQKIAPRQRLSHVMLLPVGLSLESGLPVLEAVGPQEAKQGRGPALLPHLVVLPAQLKLMRLKPNSVRQTHAVSPV